MKKCFALPYIGTKRLFSPYTVNIKHAFSWVVDIERIRSKMMAMMMKFQDSCWIWPSNSSHRWNKTMHISFKLRTSWNAAVIKSAFVLFDFENVDRCETAQTIRSFQCHVKWFTNENSEYKTGISKLVLQLKIWPWNKKPLALSWKIICYDISCWMWEVPK